MVAAAVAIAVALPAAAGASKHAFRDVHRTKSFWHRQALKTVLAHRSARPALRLQAKHVRPFTLNRAALRTVLAGAPAERTRAGRLHPVVISLPNPHGAFQRFALVRTAIMSPGLARKHPEIHTYGGRGIDDPAATIAADLSPIGFHASVRSPSGAWYIDPYLRADAGVYVSYYGRQLRDHYPFVEHDSGSGELSVDKGYYHASDTVTLSGSGFGDGAEVTLAISGEGKKLNYPVTELAQKHGVAAPEETDDPREAYREWPRDFRQVRATWPLGS